jgi:Zn-dependent oligopeptidase
MTENSFFETWGTPFGLPPFDRIRPEHFPPAFDRAMAEHDAKIAVITGLAAGPSFADTIEAMERSGRLLYDGSSQRSGGSSRRSLGDLRPQRAGWSGSHRLMVS